MSIIENILKRFGYKKVEVNEVPFPLRGDIDADLEDIESDALWGLEGFGGLSSTRRPADPRGQPAEEDKPQ